MKLTGFADEAGISIDRQIDATKALGWNYISARGIDGKNIHDIDDEAFNVVVEKLELAGIKVAEFGSLIGTWAKKISTDFSITEGEIERCIPRMKRLDVDIVRVMSYAQEPWGEDQYENERFDRLRKITKMFTSAGITVAHENCMNWGGFSAEHTLRLLEEVPNLKLIFDTGNPVFQRDRANPTSDGAFPWQDAMKFYQKIKEHIVHVHIKDCLNPIRDGVEPEYTFPGLGQGYVKEILEDLKSSNFDGFVAIEPHVATVFHAAAENVDWDQCFESYVEYGKQLEKIISADVV